MPESPKRSQVVRSGGEPERRADDRFRERK